MALNQIIKNFCTELTEENIELIVNKISSLNEDLLYEIVGEIYLLKDSKKILTFVNKIDENISYDSLPTYKKNFEEKEMYVKNYLKPPKVEKGIFNCKCGSTETISTQVQTRRGDEPMTNFISCVKCGNKWRE